MRRTALDSTKYLPCSSIDTPRSSIVYTMLYEASEIPDINILLIPRCPALTYSYGYVEG